MVNEDIICLVLGGGRGTRLDPLTRYRCKPAVPVGGKFRLVDIPISNSLNSGVQKIFVITQFNSASLNGHISQTFQFGIFSQGFVQVMAAEQTTEGGDWYQGTADAVRKSLTHIRDYRPRDVLVLSGDQLYRMDFRPMIKQHRKRGSDLTLAVHPIPEEKTSAFGITKINSQGRVESFLEKPQDPALLSGYEIPAQFRNSDGPEMYPVSMGIYLFKWEVLCALLENREELDFGHEILPRATDTHEMNFFMFDDYWEDIGTIRAYYEANLDLALANPPFMFYSKGAPIYTRPRFLGASRIRNCQISESMVCDGSYLFGSSIHNSVVSIRAIVEEGSVLRRSIVLGADAYEADVKTEPGIPPLGIGPDCSIDGAIIDKNARIGAGVKITPKERGTNEDHPFYFVRDGIVVVPKNAVVPAGTII